MSVTLTATPKLSIDQWAELMGVPILEFNNLDVSNCIAEYDQEHCSQFWSHWQYSANSNISREQLAFFVDQAEMQIENYLGYHVAPTWDLNEWIHIKSDVAVELSNIIFQTNWKNVIHAGSPKFTEVGTAQVIYLDEDSDGYSELAIISINSETLESFVPTFPNRFRLFFSGHMGEDEYEITHILSYDYDSVNNNLTIRVNSWLLVDPAYYIPKGFARRRALNACEEDIYVTEIDIGFEEVDTCLPNAQVVWGGNNEPCVGEGCIETTKPACIRWVNKCEGTFKIELVTVDEETGCINGYLSTWCEPYNMPDGIRINYISGCHDKKQFVDPPLVGIEPCPDLIRAILSLSITYLGDTPCACSCIEDQIKYYNTELSTTSQMGVSFRYPIEMLLNIFGSTKRGAIEAYRIVENIKGKKGLCYKSW